MLRVHGQLVRHDDRYTTRWRVIHLSVRRELVELSVGLANVLQRKQAALVTL